MRTDRICIARDGKSGMHVLVRIVAVGDIGADCLPIDLDGFNELMMARSEHWISAAAAISNDPASKRSVYAPVSSSISLRRKAIWIRFSCSRDTGRNSAMPSTRVQQPTNSQV